MNRFEVVDTKISRFEEWAVERFDEWWLERKIRIANHQVKLAEEVVSTSLGAAANWRDYAEKLKDVRHIRGFSDKGNDWKPPVDWLSLGMIVLTVAIAALAAALATH